MSAAPAAAILCRVSTDGQDIDSQLRDMRAQAARDGVTVAAESEYIDDGVSGATGNLDARRGLRRMLDDLARRPPPWSILYVFDFDRFLRSDEPEEQAAIIGPLKRAQVAVRDRNGETPPMWTTVGRLVAMLRLDGAAEWLAKHKAQTRRGREAAIDKGKKPAGPTPFGLTYDRGAGRWGVHPEQAAIVREIFDRVIAGEACQRIADDLAARGAPAPPLQTMKKTGAQRGGRWYAAQVWRVVTSPTYKGEKVVKKNPRRVVAVPCVVTPETWAAAQAALLEAGKRGLRRAQHVYLLGDGVGRCAKCGAPLRVFWGGYCPRTHPGKGRTRYYACERAKAGACDARWWRVEEADGRVWAAVRSALERPDLAERLFGGGGSSADASDPAAEWQREADELAGRLARLRAVEAAILRRFAAGKVTEEAMIAETDRLAAERDQVERELAAARAGAEQAARDVAEIETLRREMDELRADLDAAADKERERLVRALVPVALLGDDKIKLRLRLRRPVALASLSGCNGERKSDGQVALVMMVAA